MFLYIIKKSWRKDIKNRKIYTRTDDPRIRYYIFVYGKLCHTHTGKEPEPMGNGETILI